MGIESRMFRGAFLPDEVVQLRQLCLTPGRIFEPGKYLAGELPDLAFEMGLVDRLPPVRGKNAEIRDVNPPSDNAPSGNAPSNQDSQ